MGKSLDKFYIFTGPEVQVMRVYLTQMAKAKTATIVALDNITDLTSKSQARGLVRDVHIYTVYESREFISEESVQAFITSKNTFKNDCVVFIYNSLDKRSKVYKNMQDHIVEFEPLKPMVLSKYIKQDIKMSDENIKRLMEICENDYSRILLEIDKIKTYQEVVKLDRADKAFETLLRDGTIYQPPYDAVFDFVDAVLKCQCHRAFRLLEESYGSGEATLVLLSNLYNGTKQLLQVQYCHSDNVTESTGLTPFQVKLAKGRVGYYNACDLTRLMRLVRNAETGIKTGEIEDVMAVYYILVSLWE